MLRVTDSANWINELTGNEAGTVFRSRRDLDKMIMRMASIEKARKILGYKPKTDMEERLKKTVEWFEENMEKIEATVRF